MESTEGAASSPRTSIKSSVSSSVRRGSPAKTRTSLTPQDKGAVVLEIGHAYTRFKLINISFSSPLFTTLHICFRIGMSGEAAPRFIIKSNVAMRPYGEVSTQLSTRYPFNKNPNNKFPLTRF